LMILARVVIEGDRLFTLVRFFRTFLVKIEGARKCELRCRFRVGSQECDTIRTQLVGWDDIVAKGRALDRVVDHPDTPIKSICRIQQFTEISAAHCQGGNDDHGGRCSPAPYPFLSPNEEQFVLLPVEVGRREQNRSAKGVPELVISECLRPALWIVW